MDEGMAFSWNRIWQGKSEMLWENLAPSANLSAKNDMRITWELIGEKSDSELPHGAVCG
jgi:hypothetical protein